MRAAGRLIPDTSFSEPGRVFVQLLSKGGGRSAGAVLVEQQEQQDAQEFVHFLVDRAHEEMVALRKAHGLDEAQHAQGSASDGGAQNGASLFATTVRARVSSCWTTFRLSARPASAMP